MAEDYRRLLRLQIAGRLRAAVNGCGLSQNAIGRILGVTSGTVSGWLKGRTQPSLEQFTAICHSLELSADRLLGLLHPPRKLETAEDVRGTEIGLTYALTLFQRKESEHGLSGFERDIMTRLETVLRTSQRFAEGLEAAGARETSGLVASVARSGATATRVLSHQLREQTRKSRRRRRRE